MFKKVLFASAILVAGLGFTACSSDDDNNPPVEANPLVGEWKAETVSYVRPDNGETMTHDYNMITFGCDVDVLTLFADNTSDLEVYDKVEEDCVENHKSGTWNDEAVTVEGEEAPREVISVNDSELELKYEMTYGYGTTVVTVKYSRL